MRASRFSGPQQPRRALSRSASANSLVWRDARQDVQQYLHISSIARRSSAGYDEGIDGVEHSVSLVLSFAIEC